MMALLPEKRVELEKEKLRNMIRNYTLLNSAPPSGAIEEVCRPIAVSALKNAIHTQIAYLRRWNVHLDDETLHGWG